MKPRLRLAEPANFDPQALERLSEVFEVKAEPVPEAELATALGECDVFWFRLGHVIGQKDLAQANCKIIATPVTGTDQIDAAGCKERGIDIVSLRGETSFLREIRATAEHAIALLLALLRKLPAAHLDVTSGAWQRDRFRGREMYGKTMGLVGAGRLGTIVGEYVRAMGMRVVAYDPRPSIPAWMERAPSLEHLFEQCDVISVHASLLESTHRLIGAEHFRRAKEGLVLVNTARGAILDEEALLEALEKGDLAGAALDVLANEDRISENHPLVAYARTHSNLIITPHLGGNTGESFYKTERFLAEKVIARFKERSQ